MIKEYWLIQENTQTIIILDKLSAKGIREAEKDFKIRNDFSKLSLNGNLVVVTAERYY